MMGDKMIGRKIIILSVHHFVIMIRDRFGWAPLPCVLFG